MRTGPIGLALPEKGGEPFAITYRVDLAGRQWCEDGCAITEPLASADASEVVLRDEQGPDGSHYVRIGRQSGLFTDTLIEGTTATLRSGRCEEAPFTGFPVSIA